MKFVRMGASHAEWSSYVDYVETIRTSLPDEVYAFIVAPWHYDFSYHRCPHDAWLEELTIREVSTGDRNEIRHTALEMRLLGGYHDGHITFRYDGVRRYSITGKLGPLALNEPPSWHGDWVIDEVRLAESGDVLHEIAFGSGASVIIECATFTNTTTIPDIKQ